MTDCSSLVTLGAQGIHEEAMNYMRSVPKLTKKKTPLEIFLIRKVSAQQGSHLFLQSGHWLANTPSSRLVMLVMSHYRIENQTDYFQ